MTYPIQSVQLVHEWQSTQESQLVPAIQFSNREGMEYEEKMADVQL
jgi:hypothetical protein